MTFGNSRFPGMKKQVRECIPYTGEAKIGTALFLLILLTLLKTV